MMNIRQEDIAAENILKRAELNRITRQLKSRLSKTNLKSKLKEKKTLSNPPAITKSNLTTPKRLYKKKSVESIDANKTEDEASPIRNNNNTHIHNTNLPPSSPLYEEFQIPVIPKTPPQQKINLNTDIYNSSSTNKTQINYSSPAGKQQSNGQGGSTSSLHPSSASQQHLSTPKRPHDEGADLLMFLATSPSPIQYKNYPSTPSRSIHQHQPSSASQQSAQQQQQQHQQSSQQHLSTSSSQQSLLQPSSATKLPSSSSHKFATPATPKRSLNLLKTPGFNMNDYVNLFSPSPRITRTPGTAGGPAMNPSQLGNDQYQNGNKDVNGKLIKF